MPFISKAQEKACWVKWNKDKKAGNKPKWNCNEWKEYDSGPQIEIRVFEYIVSPFMLLLK